MAFDNHYPNRKDNRRVYRWKTSKRVDRTCRNHGSCPYCENNRTFGTKKLLQKAKDMLEDLE